MCVEVSRRLSSYPDARLMRVVSLKKLISIYAAGYFQLRGGIFFGKFHLERIPSMCVAHFPTDCMCFRLQPLFQVYVVWRVLIRCFNGQKVIRDCFLFFPDMNEAEFQGFYRFKGCFRSLILSLVRDAY